jgi:hypothetical protein
MSVKSNTCTFDNKCEKLWIVVYNQSATVTYASPPLQNNIKMRHTSTKAARRLTRALRNRGSMFQPETMVYCVVPVTPSADPQGSSLDINIETQNAINDIIAPGEYQALWWDPQWVCLGFLLKQTP